MQEDAARLLVTGHAMSDHAISTARYADQMFTPELIKKTSDFVIRASGLTAWTEGIKKAFTMEMLGYIARNSDRRWRSRRAAARVHEALPDHGGGMGHLRALPQFDFRAPSFSTARRRPADDTVRKLYEGVLQERALAVLEPDARIRSVTTQGAQGGTFMGEVARTLTMFQSFSMTMIATHMHALAIKDGVAGNRAMNNALFYVSHILAGAAIVQARQMLQGKDPIDMHHGKFWWQAATQGGGLGFYGDLIGGVTGGGRPHRDRQVLRADRRLGRRCRQIRLGVVQQKPGAIGQGIELAKHIVPGSNLWFSRLATDRLIFRPDPSRGRSDLCAELRPARAARAEGIRAELLVAARARRRRSGRR
jgi:hypothetical protein